MKEPEISPNFTIDDIHCVLIASCTQYVMFVFIFLDQPILQSIRQFLTVWPP